MNESNSKIVLATENKYKPWTEAETNFLRVNYGKMTAKEIGEKIGRPTQAVYGKVKSEKIGRKLPPYKHHKSSKKVSATINKQVQTVVEQKPQEVVLEDVKVTHVNGKKCYTEPSTIYSVIISTVAIGISLFALLLNFIH